MGNAERILTHGSPLASTLRSDPASGWRMLSPPLAVQQGSLCSSTMQTIPAQLFLNDFYDDRDLVCVG